MYGPGQRIDDRRIIPDLMTAALERKPIVLYSDGRATRTFCYIRDAIRACWYVLLSDASGEPFNIGNDEGEISMNDLAYLMHHEILDLFGCHMPAHEMFSSDRLAELFPEFLLERADTQVAAIRGSVHVIAGQPPGKRKSGSNRNVFTRKET